MKKLILFLILIPKLALSQSFDMPQIVSISYGDSFIRLKAPDGDWNVHIKYRFGKTIWKGKCYLSHDATLCLPFIQDLPKSEYIVRISRRGKRFKTIIEN